MISALRVATLYLEANKLPPRFYQWTQLSSLEKMIETNTLGFEHGAYITTSKNYFRNPYGRSARQAGFILKNKIVEDYPFEEMKDKAYSYEKGIGDLEQEWYSKRKVTNLKDYIIGVILLKDRHPLWEHTKKYLEEHHIKVFVQ